MANDVQLIKSENPIKHGSSVIYSAKTGLVSVRNADVFNTPLIADIQSKYDTRYDDLGYYFIGNSTIVGG